MSCQECSPSDASTQQNKMDGCVRPPCAKGTLRIGIFFDGTGNDHTVADKWSNVYKLFETYPNRLDPDDHDMVLGRIDTFPREQAVYIRGVGSKASKKVLGAAQTATWHNGYLSAEDYDEISGKAFGAGGYDRLHGMLFLIEVALKHYKEEAQVAPQRIELDLFGFSRGAAMARHFLNVIKQNWFKCSGDFAHLTGKDFSIQTLNIFDTVGSFNLPTWNNDVATGYTYHIKPGWVTRGSTHLIADDEYRSNFDLQALNSSTNKDYPVDQARAVELVLLGSHSDVGGGYISGLEHSRTGNALAKIGLNAMYDYATANGVPLKEKTGQFTEDDSLSDMYEDIMGYYKVHSGLKVAYKKLKERMAYTSQDGSYDTQKIHADRTAKLPKLKKRFKKAEKVMYKDQRPWTGKAKKAYAQAKKDYETARNGHNSRIELLEESLYKGVLKCFGDDEVKCKTFLDLAATFHNQYVHISHNTGAGEGAQSDPGTGAQSDWTVSRSDGWDTVYHRHIYYNRYYDIKIAYDKRVQKTKKLLGRRLYPKEAQRQKKAEKIVKKTYQFEVITPKEFTI